MAQGLGFTGLPYFTYGVTPAATVQPMATAVSEPVASNSTYTGGPEPMLRRYEERLTQTCGGRVHDWNTWLCGTSNLATLCQHLVSLP